MDIQTYRTVWLLRHGQETPERPKPLGGHLTEVGRQQAELTAQRLAGLPIQRIVASTLHRAAETAQIIAAHLPNAAIEYTDEPWECTPAIPPHLAEYFTHLSPEMITANLTQLDQAYQRCFEDDAAPGMTLLVCHGNVIRYLLCRALDLPSEEFARFDIFNCGLCRVDWKTVLGRQVTGLNDAGHLPLEMQTYG